LLPRALYHCPLQFDSGAPMADEYIVEVNVIDPDGNIPFTIKVNAPHDALFVAENTTPSLEKIVHVLAKVNA
jgi:hypothetical protein